MKSPEIQLPNLQNAPVRWGQARGVLSRTPLQKTIHLTPRMAQQGPVKHNCKAHYSRSHPNTKVITSNYCVKEEVSSQHPSLEDTPVYGWEPDATRLARSALRQQKSPATPMPGAGPQPMFLPACAPRTGCIAAGPSTVHGGALRVGMQGRNHPFNPLLGCHHLTVGMKQTKSSEQLPYNHE